MRHFLNCNSVMKNPAIIEAKEYLDRLFNKVNSFSADDELKSHLVQYLCIQVSGFVETSIQSLLTEYARNQSNFFVANYVERQLQRNFQNPNMETIFQVMKSFNPDWEIDLQTQVTDEMRGAIGSIRSNRNQIAHGRSVTISYAPIQRYYQSAIAVIELIEEQCNP